MPFGLTNAPAMFQCLMESCLGDMHLNWCIIYLDDIIVFYKTPEEHIQRLRVCLRSCLLLGCDSNPVNANIFLKSCITYLGHIVSKDGIETDPNKVAAINEWPVPRTVTEVQSFLGFTKYYQKLIPRYAHTAKPVNQLVSGENAG